MKKLLFTLLLFLPFIAQTLTAQISESNVEKIKNTDKPKIQVVFLLDATGSMGGLIETAKQKIWSIVGGLTQTDPAPEIEVGMVFYRDRGDKFVTRIIPLGKDIDKLFEKLMAMNADGGGDAPESVNQALHEGVTKMNWDRSPDTYRVMFLVGDCPPHMDYKNDVKYPESCAIAMEKNIVINSIQMGNHLQTTPIWREIADKTGGQYIQTDMGVNNIAIATPYDREINEKQYKLDQTRIYYGKSKELAAEKMEQSTKANQGESAVNARRAAYNSTASGKASYYGTYELLNDVANGKKLSEVKQEELPDNLRKLSPAELETFLNKSMDERKTLEKEIAALNKQRQQHIDNELKKIDKSKVEGSFDNVIFGVMKSQAKVKGIVIEGDAQR